MLTIPYFPCLTKVARFYDKKKVGDSGPLGFRRSTDLSRLFGCFDELIGQKILIPGESRFLDMGCGDGRVNVLFSYLVRISIGIELDEWTYDEYAPLLNDLEIELLKDNVSFPPENIHLFHGDSTDHHLYRSIKKNRCGTGGYHNFLYLSHFV